MRRTVAFVAALAAVLLLWAQGVLAIEAPPQQIGGPSPEPRPDLKCFGLPVDIYLNGEWLYDAMWPDALPFINPETNRTMIPVRFVSERLGAKVDWVGSEQKVVIELGDRKIELWVGKDVARVNGEEKKLDAPAWLAPYPTWRTYVPLRFVTECLGGAVDWAPPDKDHSRVRVFITYSAPK